MPEYSIVDIEAEAVVPQVGRAELKFNSLGRVDFAADVVVFSPTPGYEFPPQYGIEGEPDLPVRFRLYEIEIVDIGSGPIVVSAGDPVFDPVTDAVTVTRTLQPAPPPTAPEDTRTTPADLERYLMANDPGYDAKIAAIKRSRP